MVVIGFSLWQIIELLILVVACLMIVLWLYRPKSKELYKQYSMIPLDDDKV